MKMIGRGILTVALWAALGVGHGSGVARAADAAGVYPQLVADYMAGKWDDVEAQLKTNAREIAALPPDLAADVRYIRLTLGQCHPEWWNRCKAGKKCSFMLAQWGRTCSTTFDPAVQGIQFQSTGGRVALTLGWDVKDMDNPQEAEHGFTKGEINNLSVWATLGTGVAGSTLPGDLFGNDEARKLLLNRYLDFRGDLSGTYYGTPRARRWGLWLYLAAFMDKYARMPTVMARQALGAMMVAEVAGHPELYPSIKLPKSAAAEGAEKEVALHIKDGIEHHAWTLAEDRTLRAALKTFAEANEQVAARTGLVKLGNGLKVALDPARDAEIRRLRDAWVKAQLEKAK